MSQQYEPAQYNGPGFLAEGDQPGTKKGRRKGREPKQPKATRKVVGTQRRIFLILAVLVGLIAVMVVTTSTPTTYVARSAEAVNAFTELGDAQIDVVSLDSRSVEPDTWSGSSAGDVRAKVLAAIAGKRTAVQLGAHQQLRPALFTQALTPSTPLNPDERLISISARAGAAVIGSIGVGDHVDVYGTSSQGLAGILGANVEVVAVSIGATSLDNVAQQQLTNKDKGLADLIPGSPIPGTYVLRVKAADVARFVAADAGGTIYLALRSATSVDAASAPADLASAICGNNRSVPSCSRL